MEDEIFIPMVCSTLVLANVGLMIATPISYIASVVWFVVSVALVLLKAGTR